MKLEMDSVTLTLPDAGMKNVSITHSFSHLELVPSQIWFLTINLKK